MIARQPQKAPLRPIGLASRRNGRAALLASTMLTSAIFAASMLDPQSAFAASACTTAPIFPVSTITCSGTGTGVSGTVITTATTVTTTINANAVVSQSSTPLSVLMSLGGTFNYTMNNPSSVTSTGSGADAIDLTGGAGTVHGAWTIGGTIESTAGTGINIILPLGTGNSGIGMTIGAGGIVKGDNGTAISFGGVSGVNNDTVTNDGQVYAVGSGHNGIFMTAGTGSGLLTVTNEAGGIIGSSALPIGGSAVSIRA